MVRISVNLLTLTNFFFFFWQINKNVEFEIIYTNIFDGIRNCILKFITFGAKIFLHSHNKANYKNKNVYIYVREHDEKNTHNCTNKTYTKINLYTNQNALN